MLGDLSSSGRMYIVCLLRNQIGFQNWQKMAMVSRLRNVEHRKHLMIVKFGYIVIEASGTTKDRILKEVCDVL